MQRDSAMPQTAPSQNPFAHGRSQALRLGLGMAALGRPGYINLGHGEDYQDGRSVEAMQARAWQVLDAAWDAGVRYFDAARSYGRGEAFLGAWLAARQVPADAVTVASKWGYTYTADWQVDADRHEVKDHRLPVLERQWAETREHLGHWLDLYQIHSATFDSGVLDDAQVHGALARLKSDGLRIGLTLSGPTQADVLRRAMDIRVDGVRLFDAVQATWNLLEPSAGPALAQAHAEGLGVIVKEALANGRLTSRNDEPAFAGRRRLLTGLATRFGVGQDAVALAAALAQPWADLVLSGAATTAQLQANLTASKVNWDADAAATAKALTEAPDRYWQTRAALAWN
jgi:aryl-alcohol dehydrogenase-like predicted oxidoreductase